jgi:predicted kinase
VSTPESRDLEESKVCEGERIPALILICGAPCTGKTTLGKRIAKDLRFPFISKDDVKEILFDRLGWQDREWSRRLSLASFDILYYILDAHLQVGRSSVVEANFRPPWATQRFRALKSRYNFVPIQIFLKADTPVILDRFKRRAASGQRHPGHVDDVYAEALPETLGDYRPLNIGGRLLELDTTEFETLTYDNLKGRLEVILSETDTMSLSNDI